MAKKDAVNNGKEKAKRPAVDYARIEPAWRAGVKSVLQLAAEYEKATGNPVSHTAIRKHFDKQGITRDLKGKVQAKAQALVSAAAVSAKVSAETGTATAATETAIINANAELVSGVLLSQRSDIKRSRNLTISLLEELEIECENPKLLEQVGSLMYAPDENGKDKVYELYMKVISMPGRVDSMKKLADTLKVLVALEREAYNIVPEAPKGPEGLEELLDEL